MIARRPIWLENSGSGEKRRSESESEMKKVSVNRIQMLKSSCEERKASRGSLRRRDDAVAGVRVAEAC
ncbi:hypothetical protein PanWU01x14_337480 [Parasponia andersonii]|uniref:Uncharacterized protein n=1 Tax=Parasponia andersonii TaxID=3476 RepID=A0A2P5AFJ0_PARAD|nr:hypothetical protein PanWU01x14_337480 [Parasponia andersonii]